MNPVKAVSRSACGMAVGSGVGSTVGSTASVVAASVTSATGVAGGVAQPLNTRLKSATSHRLSNAVFFMCNNPPTRMLYEHPTVCNDDGCSGLLLAGKDCVQSQEQVGVAVTVFALLVLRGDPLDVVGCGQNPGGPGVEVGKQIQPVEVKRGGTDGHVAHQHVNPGTLRRRIRVKADSEIHPRVGCLEEWCPIVGFLHMAVGAVLVGNRMADLAGELIAVQDVLLDGRVGVALLAERLPRPIVAVITLHADAVHLVAAVAVGAVKASL